jgi:hypothetical protein
MGFSDIEQLRQIGFRDNMTLFKKTPFELSRNDLRQIVRQRKADRLFHRHFL